MHSSELHTFYFFFAFPPREADKIAMKKIIQIIQERFFSHLAERASSSQVKLSVDVSLNLKLTILIDFYHALQKTFSAGIIIACRVCNLFFLLWKSLECGEFHHIW